MTGLLPLLGTVPAADGIAEYDARDTRGVPPPNSIVDAVADTGTHDTTAPKSPHAPRSEYFNLAELTRTDTRGFVKSVETYRAEPWGLYLARTVEHPHFRYLESWLLPALSLRVTVRHRGPAHDRGQTYYLEVGDYAAIAPKKWRAEGHYLRVVARPGHPAELAGVDELLAAHAAGRLDTARTIATVEHAIAAVEGIAAHGHRLENWLAAEGITLTWL
ncbi:DUF402 domain-containing protein [Nocardia uniformis]|uniref:DUF402 domain-containing protein n=1 Tax=Nocardia uniformis TaxID=53432 RepID=A0A849CGD1_9NOCA|nr:DUF402 domain-containing protein [Nocardia uniformis]NNH75697.1 DUF402 domain-containing protein [Nocardia uniformis]